MDSSVATPSASTAVTQHRSNPEASLPVRAVQRFLHGAHETFGLPWWATIAACTVGFRVCLVPLVMLQLRTARRMFSGAAPAQFAHLTTLTSRELKQPKASLNRRRTTLQLYFKGIRAVMKKNDVAVWKVAAVPLVQIPIFLTYVVATRDLISHDLARQWGMTSGGISWFQDLTALDTTYILPVTAMGLTYLTIEQGWGFSPTIRNILQSAVIISSPFVLSQLPAGVFMYWIPSSMFGLAQSATIRYLSPSKPPPQAASTPAGPVKQASIVSAVGQPASAKPLMPVSMSNKLPNGIPLGKKPANNTNGSA